MPRAKIKVNSVEKFRLACELNDVKFEQAQSYGDVSVCICLYKSPQQLVEIGRVIDTIEAPQDIEED